MKMKVRVKVNLKVKVKIVLCGLTVAVTVTDNSYIANIVRPEVADATTVVCTAAVL